MAFKRAHLLIAVSPDPLRVVAARQRPWDALLAHWGSLRLDADIAGGAAPDEDRLRLVRARQLSTVRSRQQLAARWERLVDLCTGPRPRHASVAAGVPVQRRQIAAAEPQIRRLIQVLRAGRPVSVRGLAAASLLLTDGASPVYRRAAGLALQTSVRAAADHLDPALLLPAS